VPNLPQNGRDAAALPGPPRTAAVLNARVFAKQKLEGVKLHGCSFTPAQGIEAEIPQAPGGGRGIGADSPVPGGAGDAPFHLTVCYAAGKVLRPEYPKKGAFTLGANIPA
jgi:hypothetical protein